MSTTCEYSFEEIGDRPTLKWFLNVLKLSNLEFEIDSGAYIYIELVTTFQCVWITVLMFISIDVCH